MTYNEAYSLRAENQNLIGKKFKGKEIIAMLIVDKEQTQLPALMATYHRLGISEVSKLIHQDFDIVVLLEPGPRLSYPVEKITLGELLIQLKKPF